MYEVHTISFQTFFACALLLIVHTWNSRALQSNHLRLQCTCSTVPTTSGRPHWSHLVWACQWPSSQPLSSPQLSHNDSLWAEGITKSHREQGLDYREAEELSWCPSWSIVCDKDGVVDWCIVLVEMPLSRFEECWPLPKESLPELPLNLNIVPLTLTVWPINSGVLTSILLPHLFAFLQSLMPLKNWCLIHARCLKSSLKHSIRFCGMFSKFKTEFYCISFF